MDRETIIKLAHETLDSMAPDDYCREPYWTATDDELEKFAKRVAEHSASVEREACAKVCDDIDTEYEGEDVLATWCAAAIRERSANARARGNT